MCCYATPWMQAAHVLPAGHAQEVQAAAFHATTAVSGLDSSGACSCVRVKQPEQGSGIFELLRLLPDCRMLLLPAGKQGQLQLAMANKQATEQQQQQQQHNGQATAR
jgi:hypothetical protein